MVQVDRTLLPYSLTWQEVNPGTHPFDRSDPIYEFVLENTPKVRPSGKDKCEQENAWEMKITKIFVDLYGRWACGWWWAADEGSGGGGPIHEWCCPSHSWTTQEETANRVAAALLEWREWIETLAARFEELDPGDDIENAFNNAVVLLVTDVLSQTGSGDSWYTHCQQVLCWYLESHGVDFATAEALVEEAVAGRFESWVAPGDAVVLDVAKRVSKEVVALKRKND